MKEKSDLLELFLQLPIGILGKAIGPPFYRLIGGKSISRVKIYSTTTPYWAINNMQMRLGNYEGIT